MERPFEDRKRADLVFRKKKSAVVVEVKRDVLTEASLGQVSHYMENLRREGVVKVEGILVGRRIKESVLNELETRSLVQLKLLGRDIPLELVLCDSCRTCNSASHVTCRVCGDDLETGHRFRIKL